MPQLLAGRYMLLGDRLAKGGYGEVFAAWDDKASTLVAIKRQRAESSTAAREINAFHALPRHPNVLAVLESFVSGGTGDKAILNAVFRYHNSSLFGVWRAARGCLDFADVRKYCRDMFQGLSHLHRHSVCHRDLCLSNLLLSFRDNCVEIADLGLAANASSFTLERNVTQMTGRAPEVLLSHDSDEESSTLPAPSCTIDLWSAGAIVVALYVGQHLFDKEDVVGQLQAHVDFLGSPAVSWRGVVELRGWAALQAKLRMQDRPLISPSVALASPTRVKRPLPAGHAAIEISVKLLVWDPEQRMTAAQALEHPLCSSEEGEVITPRLSEDDSMRSEPNTPPKHAEGAHPAHCECKGSCGAKACAKMKSRMRRSSGDARICNYTLACGKYCDRCRCAVAGCSNLRLGRVMSRWCTKHEKMISDGHYVATGGMRQYGDTWGEVLRTVAANSWWLSEPQEVTTFDKAFQLELDHGAGGVLDKNALLRLWAAAYMKAQAAVEAWLAATAIERGVSARSSKWQVEDWARASASIAQAATPDELRATAQRQTGVLQFLQRLQQCEKCERKPCKRKSNGDIVHQGKSLKVTMNTEMWTHILSIDVQDITAPETAAKLKEVIRSLDEWLAKFPLTFLHGNGSAAEGKTSELFVRKSLTHKFVVSMSKRMPQEVFKGLSWSDLRSANGDVKGHTDVIPESWTCGEIEDCFGMHPLLISTWCSLMEGVPKHHFMNRTARILDVVEELRVEKGGKGPTFDEIVEALRDSG